MRHMTNCEQVLTMGESEVPNFPFDGREMAKCHPGVCSWIQTKLAPYGITVLRDD